MRRYLRATYHSLRLLFSVNWLKTIYLNFSTLPFNTAIYLPIYIYGKIKLKDVSGKIIINDSCHTGMIQIGKDFDGFPHANLPVYLHLSNQIIFNGSVIISGGVNITNWSGSITFGKYCTIGSGTVIKSQHLIEIGDYTRITPGCVVMDTDVHFVAHNKERIIRKNFDKIIIGESCWINSGTIISKGTVVPKYSIVARNSLLNKDYTKECSSHAFLAGVPAKVKSTGSFRIFSAKLEKEIRSFFMKNPMEKSLNCDKLISEQQEYEDVKEIFKLF